MASQPAALKRYWANKRRGRAVTSRRRVSVMARSGGHRKAGMVLPLAVILGFVPLGARAVGLVQANGIAGLQMLPSSLIPYDFVSRRITFANLGSGLWPILVGVFTHKVVGSWLGVNRMLAGSRIP